MASVARCVMAEAAEPCNVISEVVISISFVLCESDCTIENLRIQVQPTDKMVHGVDVSDFLFQRWRMIEGFNRRHDDGIDGKPRRCPAGIG